MQKELEKQDKGGKEESEAGLRGRGWVGRKITGGGWGGGSRSTLGEGLRLASPWSRAVYEEVGMKLSAPAGKGVIRKYRMGGN